MPYTKYDLAGLEAVKFNNKDSYAYYGMILLSKTIDTPQRKVTKVSSLLMDGDKDITDTISTPKYKNRKITLSFAVGENKSQWDTIYRNVCQEINGVYFDKTIVINGKQYSGRASVNKWVTSKSLGTLTIEVDALPYCYDVGSTVKRYE